MGVMRPDMIMYLVSWACCQEGMVVVVVVVFVFNVGKFPRLNWFCEKSQKETEHIKANCRHQQILETAANRPLFFLCLFKTINQAPGYEQWTRKATISSLVRLYCLYLNMLFNCKTNKLCLCIFICLIWKYTYVSGWSLYISFDELEAFAPLVAFHCFLFYRMEKPCKTCAKKHPRSMGEMIQPNLFCQSITHGWCMIHLVPMSNTPAKNEMEAKNLVVCNFFSFSKLVFSDLI